MFLKIQLFRVPGMIRSLDVSIKENVLLPFMNGLELGIEVSHYRMVF